mmetsp:Transcript_10723/g.24443  ORF Transcript_10723/g.24443 Transcript_10723/m.24443 type:complete len:223 (+) Transcript_10723:166-834(+)
MRRTNARTGLALPALRSFPRTASRHCDVMLISVADSLLLKRTAVSFTRESMICSQVPSVRALKGITSSNRSAKAAGSSSTELFDVRTTMACRKSAFGSGAAPLLAVGVRVPTSMASRRRFSTASLALSTSSIRTTEWGRRHRAAESELQNAKESPLLGSLAQFMVCSALRVPNHRSAKATASDVLPTPGGPTNSSDATGLMASWSPSCARAIAAEIAMTASS